MGMYQSKPDVYVVMFIGINGESGALAAFSTLEAAKDHVPNVSYDGPMWIERLRVDTPGFYEEEKDYIMWRSF
jgi:hypothetical protein